MNHHLDTYISDYNATLITGKYPQRSIDGCVISDDGDNFVVVDSRLDIQHLRFTIAHEVGHIHYGSIGDASKYDEQNANNFAIQILVSDKDLQSAIDDGYNDIPSFCSLFGVPYKWMEKRLQKFLENKKV